MSPARPIQSSLEDVQLRLRVAYSHSTTIPNLQVRMRPKCVRPHEMTSSPKLLCRRSPVATTVHCNLGRVPRSRASSLPPCPISGLPRWTGLYRVFWRTGGHQRPGLHTRALNRWEGGRSLQGASQTALFPYPVHICAFMVSSWCRA